MPKQYIKKLLLLALIIAGTMSGYFTGNQPLSAASSPESCLIEIYWTQLKEIYVFPQKTETWTFGVAVTETTDPPPELLDPGVQILEYWLPPYLGPVRIFSKRIVEGRTLRIFARTWASTRNERHPDIGLSHADINIVCPQRIPALLRTITLQVTTVENAVNGNTYGVHEYVFSVITFGRAMVLVEE